VARKRTKKEALSRLEEAYDVTSQLPKGGKRGSAIHELAYMGAMGLVMLDPLNRLADQRIVLPLDMVCIPAYQAYMIQGEPSLQIYVRAGETIIPTGGNVRDVAEALGEVDAGLEQAVSKINSNLDNPKAVTAYQKRYKKVFNSIASKHKKKNNEWKKGGFKRAVKEAHKMARGGK